jgi:hypothetical protein
MNDGLCSADEGKKWKHLNMEKMGNKEGRGEDTPHTHTPLNIIGGKLTECRPCWHEVDIR